jgi:hypothetical protein
MGSIIKPASTVYYIAYGAVGVFHFGSITPGLCLDTGQNTLEQFTTEAEMLARLAEVGYVAPSEPAETITP